MISEEELARIEKLYGLPEDPYLESWEIPAHSGYFSKLIAEVRQYKLALADASQCLWVAIAKEDGIEKVQTPAEIAETFLKDAQK